MTGSQFDAGTHPTGGRFVRVGRATGRFMFYAHAYRGLGGTIQLDVFLTIFDGASR